MLQLHCGCYPDSKTFIALDDLVTAFVVVAQAMGAASHLQQLTNVTVAI
jgi:hypothetical protein